MNSYWFRLTGLLAAALFLGQAARADLLPEFYSADGTENAVTFTAPVQTEMRTLRELASLSLEDRRFYADYTVHQLYRYLFGPLTRRGLGGPQRGEKISLRWSEAKVENGRVTVPADYEGIWILQKDLAAKGTFTLPMPRNQNLLLTPGWKNCTDSAPEHATESFYWYFWDPERPGCDHLAGVQYEEITVEVGRATPTSPATYPEYERMVRTTADKKTLNLTFGFGYVVDPGDPHPELDRDSGAAEYRQFLGMLKKSFPRFEVQPIHLAEYPEHVMSDRVIGYRLSGQLNGIEVTVNTVMSAGIDQMYLFAKSFAHDHDAVFAWMGHSRVGSGFDADNFKFIMNANPSYYSITSDYQLVYWAGCNSYSYYTLPFFDFKSAASPRQDPHGTRGLDILAHGLPSLFVLNALNAQVVLKAVTNPAAHMSYQEIVRKIEDNGRQYGVSILAAVLGDEDNL